MKTTTSVFTVLLIAAAMMLSVGCEEKEDGKTTTKTSGAEKPFYYCESDSDCVCDGVDEQKQSCYLGNKDYYEKHINKDMECPAKEFCRGPNNNLVLRCVANHCMQFPECSFDAECGSGRCVKSKCVTD
jgi:hypothetical protein